jgi:HlyD family secretion protein
MRSIHVAGAAGALGTLLVAATLSGVLQPVVQTHEAPVQAITPLISGDFLVAAPGRVEPASEEIRIGAAVTGVLTEVLVKEGDQVKQGDIVARLESDDYTAGLAKAAADLKVREAELLRIQNGSREAEQRLALAVVEEAAAVEKNASTELSRQQVLAARSVASRTTLDQAEVKYEVSHQKYREALEHYNLVVDSARSEDLAAAEARVEAARAARDEAQAALNKTTIRSPIDGTVLRTYRHPGELLSVFVADPILSIGDISKLYVRAEVDEADIAKLGPDMRAYVTATPYGDRRFPGKVLRISQIMGKKRISTEEPKERLDTKVLEVTIALDMPTPLRPGLQVNAFFVHQKDAVASADHHRNE